MVTKNDTGTTYDDFVKAPQLPNRGSSYEDFFGVDPGEAQAQQKAAVTQAISQTERTAGGTVKDVGVSLASGVAELAKAGAGLGNLATFGVAGKVYDAMGYNPKAIDKKIESWYSKPQQEANKNVEEAKGFLGTAETMLKNPSTIGHGVVETVPMMLAGGVIARGALGVMGKVAPKLAEKTAVKLGASALGEGSLQAGSMFEDVRQQTGGVDTKKALMSIASGVGTGSFNMFGGFLAKKLGFIDIDSMLAGIQKETGKKLTAGAVSKAIVQGGISEGVFEEMPQSAQETMWMNAATGQPIMQGVDKALAQGGLIGAAMGGGVNVASIAKQAVSPSSDNSEAKAKNEAALDLREQKLPSDELRAIRDTPEKLAESGVDKPTIDALLKERASETINAVHILEAEPNPGPLTRAGKVGITQEWAKHIMDQQDARHADSESNGAEETQVDQPGQPDQSVDTGSHSSDAMQISMVQEIADIIDDTNALDPVAMQEAKNLAQQLVDDPDVSEAAKRYFFEDTDIPAGLGIKNPFIDNPSTPSAETTTTDTETTQGVIENPPTPSVESTTADSITKGMDAMSEGMEQGARDQVADNITNEKTDRLTLKRPEAIEAAKLNKNYNVVDNADGSVTIVGVKNAEDVWVGVEPTTGEVDNETPPATQSTKSEGTAETNATVEAKTGESTGVVDQQKNDLKKTGGLSLNQAKELFGEEETQALVKEHPGLFTVKLPEGPAPRDINESATDLGYNNSKEMLDAFSGKTAEAAEVVVDQENTTTRKESVIKTEVAQKQKEEVARVITQQITPGEGVENTGETVEIPERIQEIASRIYAGGGNVTADEFAEYKAFVDAKTREQNDKKSPGAEESESGGAAKKVKPKNTKQGSFYFQKQAEKVVGKKQAAAVMAIIKARANALSMTVDDYIERRGIELDTNLKNEIKTKNGKVLTRKDLAGVKGAADMTKEGRAIIHAFQAADISTLLHELGHIFRMELSPSELTAAEKWVGAKPGAKWTVAQEEKFARGWEQYLASGQAPNAMMKQVFEKLSQWMLGIYKSLNHPDLNVKITPEIKTVFDGLLTGAEATEAFKDKYSKHGWDQKGIRERNQIRLGEIVIGVVDDDVLYQLDSQKWTEAPQHLDIFGTVNNRLSKELEVLEKLIGSVSTAQV